MRPVVYAIRAKRSAPFCREEPADLLAVVVEEVGGPLLPAAWMRGHVVDDFAAQNNTSGGSSDTDVNELHAIPAGSSPSIAVTSATPVAK